MYAHGLLMITIMLSKHEDEGSYPEVFFFWDFFFAFLQVLLCTMSSRNVQQVLHTIDCSSVSQICMNNLMTYTKR